jgi:hypothetical protein
MQIVLTFPSNGSVSSADALNQNFTNIATVVNGNVDERNISRNTIFETETITVSNLNANTITNDGTQIIKLGSADGSNKLEIRDTSGTVQFTVYSNGDVVI